MSSNPGTIYWMDIFHIHIFYKICNVVEKTKINEKEAWVGPFKKRFFTDFYFASSGFDSVQKIYLDSPSSSLIV